jgi:hypothetical protein
VLIRPRGDVDSTLSALAMTPGDPTLRLAPGAAAPGASAG